jgi:hypothetical protein
LLVRYTVLGNFRKYLTTIRARWRKRSRTGILCQTLTFVSIDTSHDPTQREREYFYPSMQLALIEIAFRVHRAQNTTFPASVPTTFQICVFFLLFIISFVKHALENHFLHHQRAGVAFCELIVRCRFRICPNYPFCVFDVWCRERERGLYLCWRWWSVQFRLVQLYFNSCSWSLVT